MPDWLARVLRTALQLVAAGGLTALLGQLAKDVPVQYSAYILLGSVLLVTFCQNLLESLGLIPVLLKPPGAAHETARLL
jgi:hypothetical protein